MTTQAFEQFRTQVSADKALQTAAAACFSSPPTEGSTGFDKLIALGKSHGFDFTAQDVQGGLSTGNATLSDSELEQVSAGGASNDGLRSLWEKIQAALLSIAPTLIGGKYPPR